MALSLCLALLLLITPVVVSQQDFLSIDCGVEANYSGYTDKDYGIVYVSDEPYTDAGENHRVAAEHESSFRASQTLRSFPSGLRNCYALPTVAGTKYLVRAEFEYGNYDGKNSSSSLEFELHLGSNLWETLYMERAVTSSSWGTIREAIFVAWAGWAPLCLVNTGRGTPFVNFVELRPLGAGLYPQVAPGLIMSMDRRRNMGANVSTWYPADPYGRYWWQEDAASNPRWVNELTTQAIEPDSNFAVPSSILQTAVAAAGNGTALTAATWQDDTMKLRYMVLLYFADFQNTQFRQFGIYLLDDSRLVPVQKSYSPSFLSSSSVYVEDYRATDGKYSITLVPTNSSVLPPMINALEIYVRVPCETPTTLPQDFDAIMAIKIEYGVKRNWMGDPCFPTKYAWDGVKCSNANGNTSRITSLDLSNSYLHGPISKNFTLLTALENLDLSYNNLSGPIPDSLPSLPSLRVLNVSGNQLSSDSACKNYTGSLIFRYDHDRSKCNTSSRRPPRNKAATVAISVVVPVLVALLVVVAYFVWRAKRKANVQPLSTHGSTRDPQPHNDAGGVQSHGDILKKSENRRFTYKELEKFTNNFKKFIGQGGFGSVYYGHLEDNTEVAVKIRSELSSRGLDEFLAEVQSLTKVHHRNLVSLIGYCWEKDHLALVYEHMSQGSLFDHLRGKDGAGEALNWRTRVQIVLEAAQGLDYLHKGCNLPIVHRDVKTSNILLGQSLQVKIADFGLSKTYLSDSQTHISATAAGTTGYMDPEHYLTGRLTESSDVYSFGVVLLEVVTGEPPIVPGQGHIIQRVKQKIATGDISSVADLRLGSAYDINSMWKLVDTAMMCTADTADQRPTMATVVIQLKESLVLEEAREKDSSVRASRESDIEAKVSTFHPSAR